MKERCDAEFDDKYYTAAMKNNSFSLILESQEQAQHTQNDITVQLGFAQK